MGYLHPLESGTGSETGVSVGNVFAETDTLRNGKVNFSEMDAFKTTGRPTRVVGQQVFHRDTTKYKNTEVREG